MSTAFHRTWRHVGFKFCPPRSVPGACGHNAPQTGPNSAIDLLVDLPEKTGPFDPADLKVALEELLNHNVDLIRRCNLKPELLAKVEAEAVPL